MTTQTAKPKAIFPDIPRDPHATQENGDFTQPWMLAFSSLFQALQKNFSNEGITFPQLKASEMATIAAFYAPYINKPLPQNDPTNGTQINLPDISGATVFDSTNRIPNQFIITYDGSTPPKVSSAQWVMFSMLLMFNGDPNGNVGGALNWFCYDTANGELLVCTTAGSANGTPLPQAVWTGVVSGESFLLL